MCIEVLDKGDYLKSQVCFSTYGRISRRQGLSCQIGSEVECFIFDDIVFENNNDQIGKKDEKVSISPKSYR